MLVEVTAPVFFAVVLWDSPCEPTAVSSVGQLLFSKNSPHPVCNKSNI